MKWFASRRASKKCASRITKTEPAKRFPQKTQRIHLAQVLNFRKWVNLLALISLNANCFPHNFFSSFASFFSFIIASFFSHIYWLFLSLSLSYIYLYSFFCIYIKIVMPSPVKVNSLLNFVAVQDTTTQEIWTLFFQTKKSGKIWAKFLNYRKKENGVWWKKITASVEKTEWVQKKGNKNKNKQLQSFLNHLNCSCKKIIPLCSSLIFCFFQVGSMVNSRGTITKKQITIWNQRETIRNNRVK